jgi:hypothetical protein
MPASDTLLIVCDPDAAPPLVDMLQANGVQAQSSTQRSLDGSAAASWLVIAAVAVKAAPDVLRALAEFLNRHRVGRVEFRGLVIENPRPQDVDTIVSALAQAGEPSE